MPLSQVTKVFLHDIAPLRATGAETGHRRANVYVHRSKLHLDAICREKNCAPHWIRASQPGRGQRHPRPVAVVHRERNRREWHRVVNVTPGIQFLAAALVDNIHSDDASSLTCGTAFFVLQPKS